MPAVRRSISGPVIVLVATYGESGVRMVFGAPPTPSLPCRSGVLGTDSLPPPPPAARDDLESTCCGGLERPGLLVRACQNAKAQTKARKSVGPRALPPRAPRESRVRLLLFCVCVCVLCVCVFCVCVCFLGGSSHGAPLGHGVGGSAGRVRAGFGVPLAGGGREEEVRRHLLAGRVLQGREYRCSCKSWQHCRTAAAVPQRRLTCNHCSRRSFRSSSFLSALAFRSSPISAEYTVLSVSSALRLSRIRAVCHSSTPFRTYFRCPAHLIYDRNRTLSENAKTKGCGHVLWWNRNERRSVAVSWEVGPGPSRC